MSDDPRGWPAGSMFPPQPPAWPPVTPTTPPKRTSRAVVLVATMAGIVLVGAAAGVGVAFATRSVTSAPPGGAPINPAPTNPATARAAAIYQRALATTRGATGFHYVAVSPGPDSQTITGDAGKVGGRQLITFNASYGAEQFTLLLVGPTVYFQGNGPAVQDQLGVSAADAPKEQGKWVSVAPGDGPYSVLQPGITVADQAQEMALIPVSSTRVTSGGAVATRIIGTIPGQDGSSETAHLDVVPSSNIPIAYVSTVTVSGVPITSTTTFTGWGTSPSVSAPSAAVAWSTLAAAPPLGGYGSGGANPGAPAPSPTASGAI